MDEVAVILYVAAVFLFICSLLMFYGWVASSCPEGQAKVCTHVPGNKIECFCVVEQDWTTTGGGGIG